MIFGRFFLLFMSPLVPGVYKFKINHSDLCIIWRRSAIMSYCQWWQMTYSWHPLGISLWVSREPPGPLEHIICHQLNWFQSFSVQNIEKTKNLWELCHTQLVKRSLGPQSQVPDHQSQNPGLRSQILNPKFHGLVRFGMPMVLVRWLDFLHKLKFKIWLRYE